MSCAASVRARETAAIDPMSAPLWCSLQVGIILPVLSPAPNTSSEAALARDELTPPCVYQEPHPTQPTNCLWQTHCPETSSTLCPWQRVH